MLVASSPTWPPAAAAIATPTALADMATPMVATPSWMLVHKETVETAAGRGLVMTYADADTHVDANSKHNVGAAILLC